MARWLNENAYDTEVLAAQRAFPTVPVEVIKAVIAKESAFRASAVRGEPQREDASIGLMQVLMSTAKGLGFVGDVDKLLIPGVNVYYGTKLLASNYARAGNWPDAISAYNGGFRPNLGFGSVAYAPARVCLKWSQTVSGKCEQWHDVAAGEYANQAYVDSVLRNIDYFASRPVREAGPPAPFRDPAIGDGGTRSDDPDRVAPTDRSEESSAIGGVTMLQWLGRIQKGRATVTGIALALLGMFGQTETAQQVVGLSEQAGEIVTVIGGALAAFGIGRKAGYKATDR